MTKQVVILNGSTTPKGNTEGLIHAFKQGAATTNVQIQQFDIRDLSITPYQIGTQPADDMAAIITAIDMADVIVWASPVHWMQFSSQLKTVLDRMTFDMRELFVDKAGVLLMAGASPAEKIAAIMLPYYQACFIDSLHWQNLGTVVAGGVFAPGDVAHTPYMQQAEAIGRSL